MGPPTAAGTFPEKVKSHLQASAAFSFLSWCLLGAPSSSPTEITGTLLVWRTSNQSILKKINPEYPLEGLMLKLKLQYFGHLRRRANSSGKTLMLGKIEGRRRRGQQRMRWMDGITDTMDMGLGGIWRLVMDRKAWRAAVHVVLKSQTRLSDWTELGVYCLVSSAF